MVVLHMCMPSCEQVRCMQCFRQQGPRRTPGELRTPAVQTSSAGSGVGGFGTPADCTTWLGSCHASRTWSACRTMCRRCSSRLNPAMPAQPSAFATAASGMRKAVNQPRGLVRHVSVPLLHPRDKLCMPSTQSAIGCHWFVTGSSSCMEPDSGTSRSQESVCSLHSKLRGLMRAMVAKLAIVDCSTSVMLRSSSCCTHIRRTQDLASGTSAGTARPVMAEARNGSIKVCKLGAGECSTPMQKPCR
jgi:hypothetical protein